MESKEFNRVNLSLWKALRRASESAAERVAARSRSVGKRRRMEGG